MKLLLLSLASGVIAQKCKGAGPQFEATTNAEGFSAYVVANNLKSPRGIVFDKEGNLLVVEQFKGVTALKFKDDNGCLSLASKTVAYNDAKVSVTSAIS